MSKVYIVVTGRFDLFGVYPNGIVDVFGSNRLASNLKYDLNEKYRKEFGEDVFSVECHSIKKEKKKV